MFSLAKMSLHVQGSALQQIGDVWKFLSHCGRCLRVGIWRENTYNHLLSLCVENGTSEVASGGNAGWDLKRCPLIC
jgi:hypothetical protein